MFIALYLLASVAVVGFMYCCSVVSRNRKEDKFRNF